MNLEYDHLILVYTGTEITAGILKGILESMEIRALLRNESESARVAGFGSTGNCEVFIFESDVEKAGPIIDDFISRNP